MVSTARVRRCEGRSPCCGRPPQRLADFLARAQALISRGCNPLGEAFGALPQRIDDAGGVPDRCWPAGFGPRLVGIELDPLAALIARAQLAPCSKGLQRMRGELIEQPFAHL